jgi:tetratricopeptide (TPR) repeat protein
LPDAIAHYRKTLELLPGFFGAHYNLAKTLESAGQPQAAIPYFEAAVQINPEFAPAHYDLAILFSEIPGREADAIRHAEGVLRLDPSNVEAHNLLAVIYAQQGLLDQAKTHWEKALQLDPGYETARENLRMLEEMRNQ